MTLEASHYNHPPLPAHLAGVHRLGIGLARWARRSANRHAVRAEAQRQQFRTDWERRRELAEQERQRDLLWAQWQLHHLR